MKGGATEKVAILVAGMHRSGTSALTRVLHIAGCDLPRTLVSPRADNASGFWESQPIANLNEEILAFAGSFEQDWRPFDTGWYSSRVAGVYRERAQEMLGEEFGDSRLFILKDPRMCRLMEFWLESVRAFGARPVVVSILRNPLDVASSLELRNHLNPALGQLIWLRHVLDAEAGSRGVTRAYARYEGLLSDARAVVDRTARDLGLVWPRRPGPEMEREIAEFLSPELRHHRSEDARVLSNPGVPGWTRDTFEVFERWSRGEVREEDPLTLDRIKTAFDEAVPAFHRPLAAARREKERAGDRYRHQVEVAARRGDWEWVGWMCEELRRMFPGHPAGYVRGAEALRCTGHLDEAEAVAGEAVARFPDLPGGHVQHAEVAMLRENWMAASERWTAFRRAFPDHPSGYVRGAEALTEAGRLDEAEAVAGEAVARFPDRADTHIRWAELAMRRRDWARASERWAALRRAFLDHASGYVRGAEALTEAGRLEEAEMLAGEALARFPDLPGGHVQYAEVAMRRGDWERASERWAVLRRAFPDHPSGYARGAEAMAEAGRLDEADAVAGEGVSRFRDHADSHIRWAEVAMRRKDWCSASERWRGLRRAFPDYAWGYVRGAKALMGAGHLEEAEALAVEAVARFPDLPGGHVQQAEVAMRRKDWCSASERWEALRRVFPDHPSGYVRGAKALMGAGRPEEAEALLCQAKERFPGHHRSSVGRTGAAMRPDGRASGRAPTDTGGET